MPFTSPLPSQEPSPPRRSTTFFLFGLLGEPATALYIALVAFIAQGTGLFYILFPELGALSHDILTRPHGTWARAPLMLVVTPFLTAVVGTLVTQHLAYGLVSVLVTVGSSILIIGLLRSPIAPAISAGLLPLVLGVSSWWYPPSLLVGTVPLAGIAIVLGRVVPVARVPLSVNDLADDIVEEAPVDYSWIPFFLAFLVVAILLAGVTGWHFVLFPPLVVIGFEMFAHASVCPWAGRPLILPVTCALSATAGVILVDLLGPGPLAATCSIIFCVMLLRVFDLHVPPALAVGLLPLVMRQPTYTFPIAVGIGTLLLTMFFLAWRIIESIESRGQQLAAVAFAVLCIETGWLYWSHYGGGAVHYVTRTLERGAVVRTVTASGIVNPAIIMPVGAHASGLIQALFCDNGAKVKAGRLCAKIDPRPYQLAVDQEKAYLAEAEARLEKDKADLVHAKKIFERNRRLARRRGISRMAFHGSRTTYARAQARMTQDEGSITERQAALHAAETGLGNTDIVSPVDGTVALRNVDIGKAVAADSKTPLFVIATDLAVIRVDSNLDEKDIDGAKLGDEATFTVGSLPDHLFAGKVTRISQLPRTIKKAATYDVVISVPNPDLSLKPGMTATVTIVTDRRDGVLRTPDLALRYSPAGRTASTGTGAKAPPKSASRLWVLRDGKPTAIVVELGLDDGAYTEIVKGDLRPDDDVIIGSGTIPGVMPHG